MYTVVWPNTGVDPITNYLIIGRPITRPQWTVINSKILNKYFANYLSFAKLHLLFVEGPDEELEVVRVHFVAVVGLVAVRVEPVAVAVPVELVGG